MNFLDRLERKFRSYIPSHLTYILIGGQILSFLLIYTHPLYASLFELSGRLLLQGQVWRLLTILFAPVSYGLLFFAIFMYFYYLLGTALESRWGSFRYMIYIGIGYLAMIISALIFPDVPVTNAFLFLSLFLAFAHLYPNFRVLVFFILPVKMKWLGYLTWFGLLLSFLSGSFPVMLLTLLSISNYLIFFYEDILFSFRRTLLRRKSIVRTKQKPYHVCAVCGTNEIANTDMEIRYCSQCIPTTCYCGEHIFHHRHLRPVN